MYQLAWFGSIFVLVVAKVAFDDEGRQAHGEVSRLVLIDSPTTLVNNEAVIRAGEEMLGALQDPIPPEFVREFHASIIHHPVPEEFLGTALSETLKVPARVWRAYHEGVALTVDDTARLDEIEVPTLMLWGKHDAVLGREEQEWRAAIPDAMLRLYSMIRAAHWPLSGRSGSCGIWRSS